MNAKPSSTGTATPGPRRARAASGGSATSGSWRPAQSPAWSLALTSTLPWERGWREGQSRAPLPESPSCTWTCPGDRDSVGWVLLPCGGTFCPPRAKEGLDKSIPLHTNRVLFPATLLVPMSPAGGTQWLSRVSSQNSNQGCGELTLIKALVF